MKKTHLRRQAYERIRTYDLENHGNDNVGGGGHGAVACGDLLFHFISFSLARLA